jgi:hypothetical protein
MRTSSTIWIAAVPDTALHHARQEPDAVKILSGVMAHPETSVQVTTGTPIALLIENTDQRSKDYSEIGTVSSRPPTTMRPMRPARLSRRRAVVGARDRYARAGQRPCAQIS